MKQWKLRTWRIYENKKLIVSRIGGIERTEDLEELEESKEWKRFIYKFTNGLLLYLKYWIVKISLEYKHTSVLPILSILQILNFIVS